LTSWFVSTTRAIGKEVEWMLTPHASEEDARAFASSAIRRGLRVEAGTVPGVEPKVRIDWCAAYHWAQHRNENSIMGLQRRLAGFAR
jgi:hypothetical protein